MNAHLSSQSVRQQHDIEDNEDQFLDIPQLQEDDDDSIGDGILSSNSNSNEEDLGYIHGDNDSSIVDPESMTNLNDINLKLSYLNSKVQS